jgi:hypothetical protein
VDLRGCAYHVDVHTAIRMEESHAIILNPSDLKASVRYKLEAYSQMSVLISEGRLRSILTDASMHTEEEMIGGRMGSMPKDASRHGEGEIIDGRMEGREAC